MTTHRVLILACHVALLLGGCQPPVEEPSELDEQIAAAAKPITLQWSFDGSAEGWFSGFTDYTVGMESGIDFQGGPAALPPPLIGGGFSLSGRNISDDLWMFTARALGPVQGIVPNADYDVAMTVLLASNAPSGCGGVGGAPGESVWLKGHVVSTLPRAIVSANKVSFSIAKGEQQNIGPAALSFGNLANGDSCDVPPSYRILSRSAKSTAPVRATSSGNLWIYFGSDSGFEGTSTYSIDGILVTLTRR
jgi:hypothetical protein